MDYMGMKSELTELEIKQTVAKLKKRMKVISENIAKERPVSPEEHPDAQFYPSQRTGPEDVAARLDSILRKYDQDL